MSSELMKGFATRTGVAEEDGKANRRYLWTDAFAVLNFLALLEVCDDSEFEDQALRTIKEVHYHLGKFAEHDPRDGWISNLPEERAEKHPTIGGLRIGKQLPERKPEQLYDQKLEWERDGQYYHYHTRWINALLKASKHFERKKFALWATELSLAGSQFISDREGKLKMYWKMSVDLSRPLVPVMGAHDPLEGLICALQVLQSDLSYKEEFDIYTEKLKKLCGRSDWGTDDALGIGGLLINTIRTAELGQYTDLPECIRPERILKDAENGLKVFSESFDPEESAEYRLAFRELGLSLGLRCLHGNLDFLQENGLNPEISSEIYSLADEIEHFWIKNENRRAPTFVDHLDISEVSLAASILSRERPDIYSRL